MFRIRKKDKVRVLSGKDKGKIGEVVKVLTREDQVLIAGINIVVRHLKAREGKKGGVVEVERPISSSKVSVICSGCQKAVGVTFRMSEKKKLRVCKECQAVL